MLGARLDTAGTWIAVISKATIPTHVELASEGDVSLAERSFDLQPNERHQVAYTGSGLGWVSARQTALSVDLTGSHGAVEVRAWVRYVPPPPPASGSGWWVLVLVSLLVAAMFVVPRRRVRHR